jgi:Fe2+ or Zn2+ uptake regulation protein
MAIEGATERLRSAGLRVTATRTAVLVVLDASDDHPRVDQIIERVRSSGLSISTQATYDVCEALRRAGLARRIEPAGGPARYESRTGDTTTTSCAAPAGRRSTSTARSASRRASIPRTRTGLRSTRPR